MAKLIFYFGKNSNGPLTVKNFSDIFVPGVYLDQTTFTEKITNKKTFKYIAKGLPNKKIYTITTKGKKLSYYKHKSSNLSSLETGLLKSHTLHENGKLKLNSVNLQLIFLKLKTTFLRKTKQKIDAVAIIKNNNKLLSKFC